MASHTEPSADSESPSSTHTLAGMPSILIASAIPSPIGSPWPSEPVATSTHGMSGSGTGCPWTGDPNFRNVISCSSVIAPIAFRTENMSGEAWPFDRTNRSFASAFGSATSVRRWPAYRTASRWAADSDDVGCPEPAAVEHRMESTASWAASSFHSRTASCMVRLPLGRRSVLPASVAAYVRRSRFRLPTTLGRLLPLAAWRTTRKRGSSACT